MRASRTSPPSASAARKLSECPSQAAQAAGAAVGIATQQAIFVPVLPPHFDAGSFPFHFVSLSFARSSAFLFFRSTGSVRSPQSGANEAPLVLALKIFCVGLFASRAGSLESRRQHHHIHHDQQKQQKQQVAFCDV